MKISSLFSMSSLLMLASTFGCTSDLMEQEPVSPEKVEIKLTSMVNPATRGTDLSEQQSMIKAGQKVGVFVVGSYNPHDNVAWTAMSNGNLQNTGETVYYGGSSVDIYAYQPYNGSWKSLDNSYNFTVYSDQSDADYANSDLLWTKKTVSSSQQPVDLTFNHKLSKVNISISSNGIDLSGGTISVLGTKPRIEFNPKTGELGEVNGTAGTIVAAVTGNSETFVYTASAIIVPQAISAGEAFISIVKEGKTYLYNLQNQKVFESGYSYTFNLTISNNQLDEINNNTAEWTEGQGETGDMTGAPTTYSVAKFAGNGESVATNLFVDYNYDMDVQTVAFHVNSDYTTPDIIESEGAKIYAEMDGSTMNLYTKADYFALPEDSRHLFNKGWAIYKSENPNSNFFFNTYSGFPLAKIESLNKVKTDDVVYMDFLFYRYNGTALDLSSFNTSKVKSMCAMFRMCNNLASIDVSGFNTAKVEDMMEMFASCSSLEELDLSNFNTVNVTNMVGMFAQCSNATRIDVSNFDTRKVENMMGMFDNCAKITALNLSSFDTSNVTNFIGMFNECSSLTSLNLSHFDTSASTSFDYMFSYNTSLTYLDISGFTLNSKAEVSDFLYNTPANLTVKCTSAVHDYLMSKGSWRGNWMDTNE